MKHERAEIRRPVCLLLLVLPFATSCGLGPIAQVFDVDPPYEFEVGVAEDSPVSGAIDWADTTPAGSYADGTTIQATATAQPGTAFLDWVDASAGGAIVMDENPCSAVLTSDLSIYARFVDVDPPYEVSVGISQDGSGSGTVDQSLPNGSHAAGTLAVTAHVLLGSRFVGWYDSESGGSVLSTDSAETFPLAADLTVYARFDQMPISFVSDRDGIAPIDNDDREIYTVLPDGKRLTRLTVNASEDKDPCWNPEKSRIAYSWRDGGGGGNFEIYTMDPLGANPSALTSTTGDQHNYLPDWSADGGLIVFNRFESGQYDRIWSMTGAGGSQTRVDPANEDRGEPSWSPDRSQIVYMLKSGSNSNIWRMDADGTNELQLTTSNRDRQPVWSPDGESILFSTDRTTNGVYQIYVMPADDGDPESNLSNSAYSDAWADWSADGSQIVFQREIGGTKSIYMMWADGSEQTMVTDNAGNDLKPNW